MTDQGAPTSTTRMVAVTGGEFQMGSASFYPEEAPVHRWTVDPFEIDLHPVTNRQFEEFVEATGYVTMAERSLDPAEFPDADPADLAPGGLVFTGTRGPVELSDWRQWWRWGRGASWRAPYGSGSGIDDKEDHPVVQVSFEDASTYAAWAGKRLLTEPEWEFAARGGLDGFVYAWGQDARPDGQLMANTWQGRFPYLNTGANGWVGTSPVMSFPPNGFGLYDCIGNVWEWTSSYYTARQEPQAPCCGPQHRGRGGEADAGQGAASAELGSRTPRRVIKGGSHLCAPEYCLRYRPAARSPEAEDTSTTHIGFRCARSV